MLVVNLFAGPGAGKSTVAAGVFAGLKNVGISAELVTEFAKECAWEGRTGPLSCQPYVFGEQLWRTERLRDKGVEVVVTDSPLLLNAVYAPPGTPTAFLETVWAYHRRQATGGRQLNVFLRRVKRYDPRGRFQTADEASELDGRILELLGSTDTLKVDGNTDGAMLVTRAAMSMVGAKP